MASPTLHIRLLGGCDVRLDGDPLPPFDSARAESLLAYLLLHRETPQSRQHLAFLLWPDSAESQARTNLRHVLHTLRHALPDADRFLSVTPRTLQWRDDAPFWLDVFALESATAREEGEADASGLDALREAVDLYGGDLLPGCYDEWLTPERERLRRHYLEALAKLITLLEARRDYAAALDYTERLLREEPLTEESYRLAMRLHEARGNHAQALRVYHTCAATLERELGVEPDPATRALYESLLPAERPTVYAATRAGHMRATPLLGRAVEWSRLTGLWRAAVAGRAQLVLLTGEPGIGKTRMVEELRVWCLQHGAAVADARSYPAEGTLAYAPLVSWLRAGAVRDNLARLDHSHLDELARLLPELRVRVPGPRHFTPPYVSDQRLPLFEAAAQALLAGSGPLLLIAEDVHWCDRETLHFLHFLLRTAPAAPLLVAATARREETDADHPLHELFAGLHALQAVSEIQLERLTQEETTSLAELASGRSLSSEDATQLYGETEGNPLFVVEALRVGWAGDEAPRRWLTPMLLSVIASRLAQLSAPARHAVDVAAVIGREFTPELLARVMNDDGTTLVPSLDELWQRRIIRDQDTAAYDFSHDKIREAAYLALSPASRRKLHRDVAVGMAAFHAADLDPVAGVIAAQWERAAQLDESIAWFQRAGMAAQERNMSVDAANFLEHALTLLRTLPDSPARATRELALLAALPAPLGAMEGYRSPRLAEVHQRALTLVARLGVELSPPLLRSLAVASLTEGNFARAQQFGQRLHQRAVTDADDVLIVESDYALGIAAFWQGQFATAREHFAAAIARYRPAERRAHLLQYGLDPKVICLSRLGNTLWFLGRPADAVTSRDAALALADQIGHPYSRATALIFASLLALDMHDLEHVRDCETQLSDLRGEHTAPQTWIPAEAIAGYLDVVDGQRAGLARIQRALDETRGVEHAPGIRSCMTRWLLEACLAGGEHRLGLTAADEALVRDAPTLWEAETRRLRAKFLAALDAPWQEVDAELARALKVARQQGARSLELRTAVSLLRQRVCRGDSAAAREAQATLRSILATLPADQVTAEIRAAQSLLD